MSFFLAWDSQVSVPPVLDTTPCLEHLMEYEDCVIDVGTNSNQYFMPAWPTLYPGFVDGKTNMLYDSRPQEMMWKEGMQPERALDHRGLTQR